jgi:LmbE family N-acetylglucosaminyl deacetylase
MFRNLTCFILLLCLAHLIPTQAAAQDNPSQLKILVIGAHPDDADQIGGLIAKYAEAGHQVKMISMTNGDAGHHEMGGRQLALRREAECKKSGALVGAEYIVLDNHDGELEPKWQIRKQLIQMMREYGPDLIITHRVYDYHPDHRYTGVLVVDAYTELSVAGNVGLTQYLKKFPVLMYMSDGFKRPYPFTPDVVIDVGSTIEKKIDMNNCHVSQFYEWIPYIQGRIDHVPKDPQARREWLGQSLKAEARATAEQYRAKLVERYGANRGQSVEYAEGFEISEYTLHITEEKIKRLFPFEK